MANNKQSGHKVAEKQSKSGLIGTAQKLSGRNLALAIVSAIVIGFVGYKLAIIFAGAGTPGVPGRVTARTGGDSIALIWDASPDAPVKEYDVFRDGTQIGFVTPGGDTNQDKNGRTFIDHTVTAGASYKYQVKAIGSDGSSSQLSTAITATRPTSTTPVPTITVDATAAPDLGPFLQNNIVPIIQTWYPKLSDAIAFPDYTPKTSFTLFIDSTYHGIAAADYNNNRIRVDPTWLRANLADDGMWLHEMTHMIQANPSWVDRTSFETEGMADWTREYFTRDRPPTPPTANNFYYEGYSPGSAFLDWIQNNYDSNFVRKLNIATHNNTVNGDYFAPDFITKDTGKTVGQLWKAFTGRSMSAPGHIRGIAGKCADVKDLSSQNNVRPQLIPCKDGANDIQDGQLWIFAYNQGSQTTGFVRTLLNNRCLNVDGHGIANGTAVTLYDCNQTDVGQQWQLQADGSVVNPNSGKCLETVNGSSNDGTLLQIWDCNGYPQQKWAVPALSGSMVGINKRCVDDKNFSTANNSDVIIYDCFGNKAQDWAFIPFGSKGGGAFRNQNNKCLDVAGIGTANGTRVDLWDCVANVAQEWVPQSDGSLKNPNSGKCLDAQTINNVTANGAILQIWDCNSNAWQKWTFPQNITGPTATPTPSPTPTPTPIPSATPTSTPTSTPSTTPSPTPAPTLPAPTGLKVYTGGTDIAMFWDTSPGTVKEYDIYRNNVKIAATTPDPNAIFVKRPGTYFTDKTVTGGAKYSYQIQVIGTNGQTSPLSSAVAVTQPTTANTTGLPTISIDAPAGYEDLGNWAKNTVIPELNIWYPKLADYLARGAYTPFNSFTIKFDPNFAGNNILAFVGGAGSNNQTMTVGTDHARAEPQDVASEIHESVHIIQDNHFYFTDRAPGWIVEGMARWAGELYFNRGWRSGIVAAPSSAQVFTDSYETSAYFMEWIKNTYRLPNLIRDLDVSINKNVYDDNSFFQNETGRSLPQLWSQMTGRNVSTAGAIYGNKNWCVDNLNFITDNGNTIELQPCISDTSEEWVFNYDKGSTTTGDVRLNSEYDGKCLDVAGGASANGTPVALWDCNGDPGQKWQKRSDGSWYNPNSRKCLDADTPTGDTQVAARLQIWDCNGQPWQKWNGIIPTGQLVHSASAKCVDDYNFGTANGTPLNIFGCVGNPAQQFHFIKNANSSTGSYRVLNKCMEVANLATANNTPVQTWDCNGAAQQLWTPQSNGSLRNSLSGRCLQPLNGDTTNNNRMVVYDCNGSAAQRITTPIYAP